MSKSNRTTRKREKCCRKCFAYVSHTARKCEFCGYVFKSPGKYLFDKIARIFKTNIVHSVKKSKGYSPKDNFFSRQEIEFLLEMDNCKILMYLILSDMNFLDETSLVELGETFMAVGKIDLI